VVVIAAAVVIGVGVMTAMANPDIGERAGQLTDASQHSISESGRAGSSLVTRALIWTTAWSAFQAHPWSGIGMFAFSYSSGSYRTIPRVLHDMYVRGLSPHQTHLAVLTETGMFGAVGFAFFMFACLRTAFRPFRGGHGHDTTREAVVAAGAMTYCFVSMFFTDAWLWGKGIVMLAIVVGIVCSIDRERSTGA
jgi:O-antigen ligase